MSNAGRFTEKINMIGNMKRKHENDAGIDICASAPVIVPARGSAIVSTGITMAIPEGHVGLLWSRSGLSANNGIQVGAGCIDSGYRGEVKVLLYNLSDEIFSVMPGDRIAQLLTIPVNLTAYEKVDELEKTSRGSGGFGSTGLKVGVYNDSREWRRVDAE